MRGKLLALALLLAGPAQAKEIWTELRTDHFTFVGNAPEKDLRRIAGDLERMRSVFDQGFRMESDPPVPVVVFVARNEKFLKALAPEMWASGNPPAGIFQNVGVRIQIGLRLDTPDPTGSAFHEYHHLLADVSTPWMPSWLSEGLAKLWGRATIDGRVVEVGRIDAAAVARANQSPIPLKTFLKLKADWSMGSAHLGPFYAQSTLLTHMLVYGTPEGEAKMQRFLQRLGEGATQLEAFEAAWGPIETVQERYDAYRRVREKFAYQRFELSKDPATSSSWVSRRLTEAQALAWRGEMIALGGNEKDAATWFRDALALDPTEPRAVASLARSGRFDAKTLVDVLARRPEAGYEAHWTAARVLATTSAGSPAVARHLEETIDRAPGFAPAWVQLAKVRAGTDPELALELLDRAIRLDPSRPELLVRVASILRDRGDAEQARVIAGEASRRATTSAHPDPARAVCRDATWEGFAREALAACDAALGYEPDDWRSRDSRGFARGLSGDATGALADLRVALRAARQSGHATEDEIRVRVDAIASLEAGRDAFRSFRPGQQTVPDEW